MRRIFRLLPILPFLILIIIGWFWWTRPQRVDMAAYVPADCLVYIEANSLLDLSDAIAATDAWQKLGPLTGLNLPDAKSSWSAFIARYTGLGKTPAVVATRAQAAFVMLNLTANGDGESLEFNSEAALVIETHTSERRVRPALENLLNDFTMRAYGQPKFEKTSLDGFELSRWIRPDGQRRIVAAVDGSVVIIGNAEKAVTTCLGVRHGQRPSLFRRPELEETRARLNGNSALAFGYVSSTSATQLIATTAPIVVGRLTEKEEFQKFLTNGAAKLIGNVGWSAHAAKGGIEDTYFVGIKPELLARLRPTFSPTQTTFKGGWEFLPANVFSVTAYNLRDPVAAWEAVNAGVSSQLDVVSAVVFTTAFRALLAPYGIDDPENFLKAVKPDLLSVRLEQSERALIIAGVASPDGLRQFVSRSFGPGARSEKVGDVELTISPDEEFAAAFMGDYFMLGSPEHVRRCLDAHAHGATVVGSSQKLERVSHYFEKPSTAAVITFSNDNDRTRSLLSSMTAIRGKEFKPGDDLNRALDALPYAVTESTLGETGLERRTRSDFGQFGFLISHLAPQPASTTAPLK
jgi:hypothetical protein